jgi:hypothetical protein
MTAKPAFAGSPDSAYTFTPRTGMIEGMTAETVAMHEFTSYWMAAGEPTASHHYDRSGVASISQVDCRSTPHTGYNAGREYRAAQVDTVVITPAHAIARIPRFAPAERDPAHRIRHANDFDTADKRN